MKEPLNFTPFDTRWVPQSVAGSDDVFTGIKVPGQEDPVTSEYVEQSGYVQVFNDSYGCTVFFLGKN